MTFNHYERVGWPKILHRLPRKCCHPHTGQSNNYGFRVGFGRASVADPVVAQSEDYRASDGDDATEMGGEEGLMGDGWPTQSVYKRLYGVQCSWDDHVSE